MKILRRKNIKSFPGYQISNFGTVRREVYKLYGIKETRIFPHINNGYQIANLKSESGEQKKVPIHKLVAKAFVSGWFEGAIVDHIDENKQNNFFKNLRWVTHRFNSSRRKRDLPLNVSKFRNRNSYIVRVYFGGEIVYLGSYKTVEEASRVAERARKQAEKGEKPTR